MPVNAADPGKALLGGGAAPQPRAAGAGGAEGGRLVLALRGFGPGS